ncbi:MAG: hypothetical protein WA733_05155 [Methylocystis sp.]
MKFVAFRVIASLSAASPATPVESLGSAVILACVYNARSVAKELHPPQLLRAHQLLRLGPEIRRVLKHQAQAPNAQILIGRDGFGD